MGTGLEILMAVGAAASGASAIKQLTSKPKEPQIVQQSPLADQAKIESEAAAKGMARRRSVRASSLLATGGAGDTDSPVTGLPQAQGKQTLGA